MKRTFLAALLCLLPQGALAQYQLAYTAIGGVDLDRYCKTVHGPDHRVVLVGNTAGDWKCRLTRVGNAYRHPISVEHACKLQYGRDGLKAQALNWNDPGSWRCMQAHYVRPRADNGPIVRDHRDPQVRDHRN